MFKSAYERALLRGIVQEDDTSSEASNIFAFAKKIAEPSKALNSCGPLQSLMPQLAGGDKKQHGYEGGLLDRKRNFLPLENPIAANSSLDKVNMNLPENCDEAYTRYHLLEAYGSREAFNGSNPGVSVFDQNRILAGVAACIDSGEQAKEGDAFSFLLIKGAISGIQEYIYGGINRSQVGSTKKLSKRLRGRSFHIAEFNDLIGGWLVDRLNLEQANIIFSGGGQFMVVAPNTKEVVSALTAFKQQINLMISDKFGGTMSFILAHVETDQRLLEEADVYIALVNKKLEAAKKTKHLEYLGDLFERINNYQPVAEIKADEEFGWWLPKRDLLLEITTENVEEIIGKYTYQQVIKGSDPEKTELKSKQGLIATFKEFDTLIFLPKNEKEAAEIINDINPTKSRLIRLNNANLEDLITNFSMNVASKIGYGFKWVGNYAPTFKDKENENNPSVVPFEELANLFEKISDKENRVIPHQTRQFPLTIMRLDIDDLGILFTKGLGENNSFANLAAMSREFHLFFGGYFNELAEAHNIYITYSGGDDAFVVGSWSNIIAFSAALHQAFTSFVCKNEKVHFSAGIFTCNPHYPVARFATDAAIQLDKFAKKVPGKNCIRIFGHTYSWDQFHDMLKFKDKLLTCTDLANNKAQFSQALIYRLLQLIKSSRKEVTFKNDKKQNDPSEVYQSVSRLHYLFARNGFTDKELKEKQGRVSAEVVTQLLRDFSKLDATVDRPIKSETLKYLLPTQYVILNTREQKIKKS